MRWLKAGCLYLKRSTFSCFWKTTGLMGSGNGSEGVSSIAAGKISAAELVYYMAAIVVPAFRRISVQDLLRSNAADSFTQEFDRKTSVEQVLAIGETV